MTSPQRAEHSVAPFDTHYLDRLMEEHGLDVIVATSKHNVQYLLGGYRFFFFETMEAMGTSRYVPAVIYRKGRPAETVYVGCAMESFERDNGRLWPASLDLGTTGSEAAARQVVRHVLQLGPSVKRIGIEGPFIPADAAAVLREGLNHCTFGDAVLPLERLRARKTPREIACLRDASERVVDAMLATFGSCAPHRSKAEIAETLRLEEVKRGLVFDYCLITAGTSLNRAPSPQRLARGDIISLDSGANQSGYLGDLCRMAILGKADAELTDLLGIIEEVQQATRRLVSPGTRGGDIVDLGLQMAATSPQGAFLRFEAHGMGLVSHEALRLMDMPHASYTGCDRDRPLESGMAISIETTMSHPRRGLIKLEDTILVTENGYEALGDAGRGWNEIAV
jgi:Xaa-Pro aminopeptidase